jgi:hypothetical protein
MSLALELEQLALAMQERLDNLSYPNQSHLVDLNKVLSLLQAKKQLRPQVNRVPFAVQGGFNWHTLRSEMLESTEHLVFDIKSLYHFGYQYYCGNSVLSPEDYKSVHCDAQISMNRFETSFLLGALWIGSQAWNASGNLIHEVKKVLYQVQAIASALTLQIGEKEREKVKFLKKKLAFLINKFGSSLLPSKEWVTNHDSVPVARRLKSRACKFVASIDGLLDVIQKVDYHLIHAPQFKSASEVKLVLELFEDFNNVLFSRVALADLVTPSFDPNVVYENETQYYPSKPPRSSLAESMLSELTAGRQSQSKDGYLKSGLVYAEPEVCRMVVLAHFRMKCNRPTTLSQKIQLKPRGRVSRILK